MKESLVLSLRNVSQIPRISTVRRSWSNIFISSIFCTKWHTLRFPIRNPLFVKANVEKLSELHVSVLFRCSVVDWWADLEVVLVSLVLLLFVRGWIFWPNVEFWVSSLIWLTCSANIWLLVLRTVCFSLSLRLHDLGLPCKCFT